MESVSLRPFFVAVLSLAIFRGDASGLCARLAKTAS